MPNLESERRGVERGRLAADARGEEQSSEDLGETRHLDGRFTSFEPLEQGNPETLGACAGRRFFASFGQQAI